MIISAHAVTNMFAKEHNNKEKETSDVVTKIISLEKKLEI